MDDTHCTVDKFCGHFTSADAQGDVIEGAMGLMWMFMEPQPIWFIVLKCFQYGYEDPQSDWATPNVMATIASWEPGANIDDETMNWQLER